MDEIGRTHARILAALWALEGSAWLEVQSEIHEAYKEMPFWILLAPDMLPIEAHRHFLRAVEPELAALGAYRVTVSYKSSADGHALCHGFFDDLDQMQCALTPEGWGEPIRQDLGALSIFRLGRKPSPSSGPKPRNAANATKRQ